MKLLLFLLLLFPPFGANAQLDTTVVEVLDAGEPILQDGASRGKADTLHVEARAFEKSTLEELKDNPDLRYENPPTIAQSLWERFLIWLSGLFDTIFETAVSTSWGRLLSYLLGLAVLVLVIMLILKIDAFKIFYSGQGASTMKYNVLDENIHDMDFEKEIQAALQNQDYRRGVRLLFLFALKILSDHQYIAWQQGKTNHEYVDEVKEESVRNWLNQLSYYFDYAWYGNFQISKDLFDKVNRIFSDWKDNVR